MVKPGAHAGDIGFGSGQLETIEHRNVAFTRDHLARQREGRAEIAVATRDHAPEPPSAEHPESHPLALRPAVITYFRQGRLDKFFRSHAATEGAEELDFFTTAETLETTASEKRGEIDPEQFYPLLDKNKTGFTAATTLSVETLLPSTASGSGNEAIILKRLRAKDVRTCKEFSKEDRQFLAAVQQIIADGRVGKATIRKVKEAFDKTAAPMEMLAILRRDIASQYLIAIPQKREKDEAPAPRELILSSYLP